MFYIRYALSELMRRRGRTILTIAGFALGVAVLIIAALTADSTRPRRRRSIRSPASAPTSNLIPTLTAPDNVVAGLAPMGVDDDDGAMLHSPRSVLSSAATTCLRKSPAASSSPWPSRGHW